MNKNNYCVIMAGGVGSRFWPMSTSKMPKQFHDILGVGKTLLQQTFERLSKAIPTENIFIITNKEHLKIAIEQLPQIKNQIVGEPCMMNTSACNLYMAEKIIRLNPKARLLIAPSDHLILDEREFVKKINEALKNCTDDNLITLGINPIKPETGYGYIQYNPNEEGALKRVITFVEKPDKEAAQIFLESGEFLWNSGIFIWSAKSILKSFKQFLPEMYTVFHSGIKYNTAEEYDEMERIYPTAKKISIDYGILEKAKNVNVIPSSFGWSDLGTWNSVYEYHKKDEEGNAVYGNVKHVKIYETNNSIVVSKNEDKAIIVAGLEDHIVVDTEKALLICPLSKSQEIKNFVKDLKLSSKDKFV